MSTFTPGPWRVNNFDYDRYGPTVYVEAADGSFVCQVVRNSHFEEIENARLIAAAPELLETLTGILACVSVRIDDPRIEKFDAARAVIAKAKGEIE